MNNYAIRSKHDPDLFLHVVTHTRKEAVECFSRMLNLVLTTEFPEEVPHEAEFQMAEWPCDPEISSLHWYKFEISVFLIK